jgi:hypothetical protein
MAIRKMRAGLGGQNGWPSLDASSREKNPGSRRHCLWTSCKCGLGRLSGFSTVPNDRTYVLRRDLLCMETRDGPGRWEAAIGWHGLTMPQKWSLASRNAAADIGYRIGTKVRQSSLFVRQ